VVDNSGSMSRKRPSVNKSTLDLIQASNPQDEAFVVNFSDEAFIDQDFTSDVNKLRAGLEALRAARRHGALRRRGGLGRQAGLRRQGTQAGSHPHHRRRRQRLDAQPGADHPRVQQLSGPVIYSIGLLFGDEMSRSEAKRARRALEMLSTETGGMAFFPKNIEQVDQIAAEVARDIRNQYTLGYHSTKPTTEPGFRRVEVVAEGKGDGKLTVRTRTGYFPVARVHAGQYPDPLTGAVNVPVYLSSTFELTGIGTDRGWDYSRAGNPTRDRLEEALAALEGGVSGHAFASGMAAIYGPGGHAARRRPPDLRTPCLRRHNAALQSDCAATTASTSSTWTPATSRPSPPPSGPRRSWCTLRSPSNPLMVLTDISRG
jgi:hypothetical protein